MRIMKTFKKNAGTLLLLVLALGCLLLLVLRNQQAVLSKPGRLQFIGEYSADGESWSPMEGADFSTWEGDLFLRGHFDTDIPEGLRISWYRDHIGVELLVNGELVGCDTTAMLLEMGISIMPDVCGGLWDYQLSPGITPEDTVEIRLYDPHPHGNEKAVGEFLNNLFVTGNTPVVIQGHLKPFSSPWQAFGMALIIAALLMLGGALASLVMRSPFGGMLWRYGLTSLFAGGFLILDTVNISFISELIVFNTYGKILCGMLAVYFGQLCLCGKLTGKRQTVADLAVGISALLDCLLILLSLTGRLLYDELFYWRIFQWVLCPVLMACAALELRYKKDDWDWVISGLLLMGALLLDMAGVGESMYSHGTCAKLMFLVLFGGHAVVAVRHMVMDHRASIRAEQLEKELEDSRIAAMLSQLQPHFLYNVLNSIYQLCEVDPKTAQDAIEKFSDYLRSNMASLEEKELIPFEEELHHIETYLSLEKIRFPSTLQAEEDIQATQFKVPPLTVQVLVENAVKHGVTKKRGGGTVTVATREEPDFWRITVSDTGRGFDPDHYGEDGKKHFGLRNAKERLRAMVGGTMTITSAPGQGTKVEIRIPKGERK